MVHAGPIPDPHEAPPETVVREVREETGLEVEVDRSARRLLRLPAARRKIVVCEFFCRVVGGEPTLSDETVGLGWSAEGELLRHLRAHRVRLADAFAVSAGEAGPPSSGRRDGAELTGARRSQAAASSLATRT